MVPPASTLRSINVGRRESGPGTLAYRNGAGCRRMTHSYQEHTGALSLVRSTVSVRWTATRRMGLTRCIPKGKQKCPAVRPELLPEDESSGGDAPHSSATL